ncbi:MAG: aspartyl/glutamyl-tRNA amidotransferase subunit C, partial [Thermogutta sp.]|nr:aspartyl/glutamyl-tRNA amidotransferase subunit C [Thermogutta sp.]
MAVSEQEIRKVALLARLELTPEETRLMASQLSRVLEYMELLGGVDTEGVEPL